jgi:lipopolysaccharide transport system permease protein
MTGLVPFLALNDVVLRAARVFRAHATLVQRVRFPAEVLVVGDVLGTLMHHGVALVIVVGYCGLKGHVGVEALPWMALGIALAVLWILGLSLVVSVLGAFLPDVAEVLTVVLQIGFYGAPIVYPLSLIKHEVLLLIIQLNPLTQLIGVIRAGLISAAPPPLAAVAAMAVVGVALVAVGAAAMDRWRYSIPDAL